MRGRLLALLALSLAVAGAGAARAQYAAGLSNQEKNFYDYGPSGTNGKPSGTSIFESGNPMDLMNKIRKGTAMDDATSPTDSIDAALKALEVPATPSAPVVKAP
jgi:hypothetical protein